MTKQDSFWSCYYNDNNNYINSNNNNNNNNNAIISDSSNVYFYLPPAIPVAEYGSTFNWQNKIGDWSAILYYH